MFDTGLFWKGGPLGAMKKILCTILAVLAFLLSVFGFVGVVRDMLGPTRWSRSRELVYSRPVMETAETVEAAEVTETAEAVPETLPPETLPPETKPVQVRPRYEKVPLYDQTDYPDILYRSGTLATSGSNIASLAMAATYLTGHEYLPDQLADYFADYIGNAMQWLEYASGQLQLPWKKAADIDETIRALRDGKIAVVRMNEKSVFMDKFHFVVFTGITEDGKILVNDPYGPNYTAWHLEKALAEGFARGDLTGGYSGGWIYDPAAVPEDPFIYQPEVNTDPFRYGDLELSREDRDLIARLICAEGASEPFEGQQAIAEVIINRIAADNFPGTAKGVIHAQGQFLAVNSLHLQKPTHVQYEAVERALNGPYILDADVVFFSQFPVNDNVWGTIGSHIFCRQW